MEIEKHYEEGDVRIHYSIMGKILYCDLRGKTHDVRLSVRPSICLSVSLWRLRSRKKIVADSVHPT